MTQSLTAALPVAAAAASQGKAFARIAVHDNARDAQAVWAELEAIAPASCYQTRSWLTAWMQTIGAATDAKPMLIAAYDAAGRAVLFLPLCTVRSGGQTVARFMGGKDANFNMALIRPGTQIAAQDIRELLLGAREKAARKPDLYLLQNQPLTWEGASNPLSLLPHQPSPSFGYKTALAADAEAVLRDKLSKDTARKLRRKEGKLAEAGPVAYVTAASVEEARPVIAAFLLQKAARLKGMGIAGLFESPAEHAFFERMSAPDPVTGIAAAQWHALTCGGRIVATYAGGVHRGRFHGIVSSFDMAPGVSVCSPGELLLKWLVADCCRRGLATFDLGVGEAGYKNAWCDVAEPLFDTLLPVGAAGRARAALEAARLALKRRIKQTPWLWALAKRIRAWK